MLEEKVKIFLDEKGYGDRITEHAWKIIWIKALII